MPISNFYGDTFVAFMDISGFKNLMQQNRAIEALNQFYSKGYQILRNQNMVEGLFISDSGILFVKDTEGSVEHQLHSLLDVIREINIAMLENDYMLTTSIAYGEFSYHNRIEFPGIEKNPIYGGAYVKAFLDNENGIPKLEPGLCRILYDDVLKNNFLLEQAINYDNGYVLLADKNKKHVHFYWNVTTKNDIEYFEKAYKDSINI